MPTLTVTKVSVPSLCTEKGTLVVMYPIALNGSNIPIPLFSTTLERSSFIESLLKLSYFLFFSLHQKEGFSRPGNWSLGFWKLEPLNPSRSVPFSFFFFLFIFLASFFLSFVLFVRKIVVLISELSHYYSFSPPII